MKMSENNKLSRKEQHSCLFGLAKIFHHLCEDNHIPYYMLGGTMLGAIRHKGFIPWDDDMDFGIPRDYYPTFLEICKKELPPHIKLLNYDNSDYAILGFAKLSDSRTIVHEEFAPITDETLGINIDIFPLDPTNGRADFFSRNRMIRNIFKFQKLLFVNPENRPIHKKLLAITAQNFFRLKKTTIPQKLERMLVRESKEEGTTMYANYFGAWGLKETVPMKIFGKPTLYQFEDMLLYGAQDADGYLTHLYGNYHIIPDESKRHTHSTEVYYIGDNDS